MLQQAKGQGNEVGGGQQKQKQKQKEKKKKNEPADSKDARERFSANSLQPPLPSSLTGKDSRDRVAPH